MAHKPDTMPLGSIGKLECPACGQPMQELGTVPMRDFDGALFNRDGVYWHCLACGMSRVAYGLTDEDIAGFYTQECLYSVLSGVGVGGDTPEDRSRYAYYVGFMRSQALEAGTLADIGCSRGGFVRFLADAVPEIITVGVDCDAGSLKNLEDAGLDARVGDVFSLPLSKSEADVVSYFHVLEHLYDIDAALGEAARVLKPSGVLLIEVPDASRYFASDTSVGPMFWLALKEHVNHFSPAALAKTLARNGFVLTATDRSAQPMKGDTAYPSLIALATKTAADLGEDCETFDKGSEFAAGFAGDIGRMRHVAAEIAAGPPGPISFWGIGLEFFALYGYLAPLLSGREVRLFDSNPSKQGLTVDGRTVVGPSDAPVEGTLVCCSYMAAAQIVEAALALGWQREAIRCLQ